MKGSTG